MNYIEFENCGTNILYNYTLDMYNIFTSEIFPHELTILDGFQDLIYLLYQRHNQEKPIIRIKKEHNKLALTSNNTKDILLGFSGGLDSLYWALKLRDEGYNVILFHITNLNRVSNREDIFAKKFAEDNNFQYIERMAKHIGKEFFIDNPLKDQLILASMIEYGVEHGINMYTFGDGSRDSINEAMIGATITDSIEVTELYWKGVTKYINGVVLKLMPSSSTKYEHIEYIYNNYPEILNYIYSCISPHRFFKQLHDYNEQKYNIKLLDGSCGSCCKCCIQIIYLTQLGYYKNNDALVKHCWDILANSKTSIYKNICNKKIPIELRYKNIMEV